MFSDGSGTGALSFQLEWYRVLDERRRSREMQDVALNDAAWRNHYDKLRNDYNRLLNEANAFGDKARKLVAEQDERILALRAEKKELVAENEQLKSRLREAELDVAIARQPNK